jgi:hypothetical protein
LIEEEEEEEEERMRRRDVGLIYQDPPLPFLALSHALADAPISKSKVAHYPTHPISCLQSLSKAQPTVHLRHPQPGGQGWEG